MKKIIVWNVLIVGVLFFASVRSTSAQGCLLDCNQPANNGRPCCVADANGNMITGTCGIYGGVGACVPSTAPGNTNVAQNASAFSNPLQFDSVQGLAANILSTLRTIIVVLSIIFIVLGGVLYITSAGNEKRMTAAKGSILASLIGFAIGIAAPSFLREIYTLLGGRTGSGIDESQLVGLTLSQIALNFLNFLLAIVGILALIMLIVGGIMYITSAGDDDRIKTAKKIATYSAMGIAVSLAALIIVKQVANLLR